MFGIVCFAFRFVGKHAQLFLVNVTIFIQNTIYTYEHCKKFWGEFTNNSQGTVFQACNKHFRRDLQEVEERK